MGAIADTTLVKSSGLGLKLRGGSLADAYHNLLLHCFLYSRNGKVKRGSQTIAFSSRGMMLIY
ncbi:hypothetical protein D3C76_1446350 [compost metagenome]